MIMIPAPQQILVDSGTGSNTDSVAVTKDALPLPNESVLDNYDQFDQSFRSDGLPDSFPLEANDFESLAPGSWLPEPTPPPRIDEATPSTPVTPVRSRPAKSEASAFQNLFSEHASRQALVIAGIGLCSVLLACGAFVVFLKWYARPTSVAQNRSGALAREADRPLQADTNARNPRVSDNGSANDANTVDAQLGSDNDSSAQAPSVIDPSMANVAPDPLTSSPSATTKTDVDPVSTDPLGGDPTRIGPNSASVSTSPPSNSSLEAQLNQNNPATASVAPSGDPLESAPDLGSALDASADALKTDVATEKLPPGLQNFASIFDQALVPVLSDATVPLAEAPDAGDVAAPANEATAEASPAALSLPEVWDQKQKVMVSGLLIQKRPLAEVLSTLSMTVGLPFIVDFDALAAAGLDRNMLISYRAVEPLSVKEMLDQISQDSGLSFEPYNKQLIIVRGNNEAVESRLSASLPIDHLVNGSEQSDALFKAIDQLLPELASEFQIRDGVLQTELKPENRLLWFQVARVLETWRQVRGIDASQTNAIAPESSRLPAWPLAGASEHASKTISQRLLPEPLAVSWQRLSSEAGLTCWIDWPSLASAQTSPSTVSMAVSRGRPLQDLLAYYADKYDLAVAVEDDQTLWVTTSAVHRYQPRLYVLPMAGKSLEEWQKELEPLTPLNPADGSSMLRVVPAPDGQTIFVRCCRPLLAEPRP